MLQWLNKEVDLGEVSETTKHKISFRFKGSKYNILDVKKSCSKCTRLLGIKENEIVLEFKTEKYPYHLHRMGINKYNVQKSIFITYINGTKQKLVFKGTIKKE